MEIFAIILITAFLLSSFVGFNDSNEKATTVCFEILKCSSVALMTFCVCYTITLSNPQAIDVYRGKTTLEITYKDSIPVDSVVVFK